MPATTNYEGDYSNKIQLAVGTIASTVFTISSVARYDTGIWTSSENPQIEVVSDTLIVFTAVENPFCKRKLIINLIFSESKLLGRTRR